MVAEFEIPMKHSLVIVRSFHCSFTWGRRNGGWKSLILDPLPGLGPRACLQQEARRFPAVVVERPVEGVPQRVIHVVQVRPVRHQITHELPPLPLVEQRLARQLQRARHLNEVAKSAFIHFISYIQPHVAPFRSDRRLELPLAPPDGRRCQSVPLGRRATARCGPARREHQRPTYPANYQGILENMKIVCNM